MSKRYRLKDWDSANEPLNDPKAWWRKEPATERQFLRLKFFGCQPGRTPTKGEAADLLDSLEPTMEELEDYDDWKRSGSPNIGQWRKKGGTRWQRHFPAQKKSGVGCASWIGVAFLVWLIWTIFSPSKPTIPEIIPVVTQTGKPLAMPSAPPEEKFDGGKLKAESISKAASPAPTPAGISSGAKVRLVVAKVVYLARGGTKRLEAGTPVIVRAASKEVLTVEAVGETFNVARGEVEE
jgi:hypothetical protein